MQGELKAESHLGRGTTLGFTPLIKTQPLEAQSKSNPRSNLDGLRALLIESNATNKFAISHYCETWNIMLDVAQDSRAGIDALHRAVQAGQPFDFAMLASRGDLEDRHEIAQEVRAC